MAKTRDLRRAEVDEQIMACGRADVILAVDPSSIAIGLAAMSLNGCLYNCTVVKAKGTLGMVAKIEGMVKEMYDWFDGIKNAAHPAGEFVAVIELPDGMNKAGGKGQQGAAVYGAAAGWVACSIRHLWEPEGTPIITPSPRMWNGGRKKVTTQRMVALEYPEYDPARDKDGDASDAIALAQWAAGRIRWRDGEVR